MASVVDTASLNDLAANIIQEAAEPVLTLTVHKGHYCLRATDRKHVTSAEVR